jgi:hypothetical protein
MAFLITPRINNGKNRKIININYLSWKTPTYAQPKEPTIIYSRTYLKIKAFIQTQPRRMPDLKNHLWIDENIQISDARIRQYIYSLRLHGEPIISKNRVYKYAENYQELEQYKETRLLKISYEIIAIKNMKLGSK